MDSEATGGLAGARLVDQLVRPGDGARALPEPVGFRTRYRSEPEMIGHYPWSYADHRRRKYDRPECEYEDLFTRAQLDAEVTAERERWLMLCEQALAALVWEAGPEPVLYAAQTGAAIKALRSHLGQCVHGGPNFN